MIPLYVQNGTACVWNAEDWHTLRTKYRICGSLIGTVPSHPRQNDFSGLPMALMSEEAALLVEKGFGTLYELPNITDAPTEGDKKDIEAVEKRILEEQQEALKKNKIDQLSQKIDIIVAGKQRKLQSKGITDLDIDKQALLQEEINKLQNVAPVFLLTHIPTEHHLKTELKPVEIDALQPSIIINEGKSVKYRIFKNLWEKGLHITSGSNFSCDFLVYPGDPVRFHATYMVRCIEGNSSFKPIQLVAFGRLSVAVKKMAVLAYCNGYNGAVQYQTLQWHDSTNLSLC